MKLNIMSKLAWRIAHRYFAIPFDGDPETLAEIVDSEIKKCSEAADYCALAGDCDQCLNPERCICEHHGPSGKESEL